MLFSFFGSQSVFFGDAFFGSNGVDVNVISGTSTEIVVNNPETGVTTTITGSGFTYDSSGDPISGTITGFSFAVGGTTQATLTGVNWALTSFGDALDEIDWNDNYAPMAALLSQSPITFDGSSATVGMDLSDMVGLAQLLTTTVTITGTDFDDVLIGGAGNDTITPGANDGYDFIIGTTGNDLYDFSDAEDDDFYEMSYSLVSGPITVNLDVSTNTGSIVGAGWTDTLLGVEDAANAPYGGLSVAGTAGNDTFNLTAGSGWLAVGGGDGSDTYNVSLDGVVRLYFNWAGYNAPSPTQGLNMDLSTGTVSNDGFGNTDYINVVGGTGRLEIRATNNTDTILGSARGESFILQLGDDTLDGGLGFDRLRYDRSGVDAVNVNLETGIATGTWFGSAFTHTISGIEWVRGSRWSNDTLTGDSNANYLDGRGGNDTLIGGGGADTLVGGDGNDTIFFGDFSGGNGGAGNDTYDFSQVTTGWAWLEFWDYTTGFTVTVNGVANTGSVTSNFGDVDTFTDVANVLDASGLTIMGSDGAANDVFNIHTGSGQWIGLYGRDGVDSYNLTGLGAVRLDFRGDTGATVNLATGVVSDDGYGNAETITGTVWELRGGSGNDTFTGSANDESFILEGGSDVLDGGLGFDRLRFDREGMGGVTVDLLAGTATGTFGGRGFSHSVTGIEWVRGSSLNDWINGSNEDNLLEGQGGLDTLYGLDGDDTLRANGSTVLMYGGNGNDEMEGSGQNDTLYGGIGNDMMTGNGGNDELWGGVGDDSMYGDAGNDLLSGADGHDDMRGGTGNDTFYGGAGDDTLSGGDGNDLLWTGLGTNVVFGGAGDDTIGGGTGDDELWGGTGANIFYGGEGNDTLGGGTDNDEIWSGAGADLAYGGAGDDTIAGGAGNDELWAGLGADLLFGNDGTDTISGGAGDDTVWGANGADLIYGVTGADQLAGGAGNDTIWAGDDNDVLWGNADDDLLYGGLGNDTLVGHDGNDTMTGGAGADNFVLRTGYGADVVTDFSGLNGDRLTLDDALWTPYGALTALEVVNQFGSINAGGHVVLTFDDGESITLLGVGSLTGLELDISII